jgi:hypothetical protein
MPEMTPVRTRFIKASLPARRIGCGLKFLLRDHAGSDAQRQATAAPQRRMFFR